MKYELLWAPMVGRLNDEVNELIKDGWKLYGSPFSDDQAVYQAMVKE
ncbi:DUF1737 domain-containing protein [Weissella paramesenteroides]|uniref:DUF1737 domain-containing protein n=1 Tax=Weissella paramesenteroides ATCC 33313 TaxID=585506 RepID=C5R805_WEIPA|nr:DUF1737 domain-containing protein [Weissella paramesenteroides]EER75589.1 hypothetical protein HMPREF0877_0100 [Weissella paramesenteroides ATCC 33313]